MKEDEIASSLSSPIYEKSRLKLIQTYVLTINSNETQIVLYYE